MTISGEVERDRMAARPPRKDTCSVPALDAGLYRIDESVNGRGKIRLGWTWTNIKARNSD